MGGAASMREKPICACPRRSARPRRRRTSSRRLRLRRARAVREPVPAGELLAAHPPTAVGVEEYYCVTRAGASPNGPDFPRRSAASRTAPAERDEAAWSDPHGFILHENRFARALADRSARTASSLNSASRRVFTAFTDHHSRFTPASFSSLARRRCLRRARIINDEKSRRNPSKPQCTANPQELALLHAGSHEFPAIHTIRPHRSHAHGRPRQAHGRPSTS